MQYSVGDIIMTKKPHACGGQHWEILRTGADFRIKCTKCGRVIMMGYDEFTPKVKKVIGHKESKDG